MPGLALISMSPLAVATSAWQRRSVRAAGSVLLARLATPVTVQGVQAALRDALGDPTAVVSYRLPGGPGFLSAAGEPGLRLAFPVADQDGEVFARLTVDASRDVDHARVEAALAACRPALENARLQAMLQRQLQEERAARTQIVQTALLERRRLARNLHDGAQQHLHALSASLALARQKATQPAALAAIDAAREHLQIAITRLRGLGRDLYPPLLEAEGLADALESLADEEPLDIEVNAPAGRLPPEAEIVMYLTVREILDGLAGHCMANCVTVTVAAKDERLSTEVTSDGELAATDSVPVWLAAIRDRIEAFGGQLSIGPGPQQAAAQEEPEERIRVEAWIPCA